MRERATVAGGLIQSLDSEVDDEVDYRLRPDVSRLDSQGFGDVGLSTVCADEREGLRCRSIGEQFR
jgi:hypothetical protein